MAGEPGWTGGLGVAESSPAGGDDAPKKKKTRVKKPDIKIEEITFDVVAKLGRFRKGKATLNAGGRLLKVEIADDAKVLVDVADISLARPGDSVKLDAWYLPKQPGRAVAQKVTISSGKPFAWESKKKKPLPTPVKDGEKKDSGENKEQGEGANKASDS